MRRHCLEGDPKHPVMGDPLRKPPAAPLPHLPRRGGPPAPGDPQRGGPPAPGDPQRGGPPAPGDPQRGGPPAPGDPQRGGPPAPGDPQRGGPPASGDPQRGGPPEPYHPQRGGPPEPYHPQRGGPPAPGDPQRGGPPAPGDPQRGGPPAPGDPQRGGPPAPGDPQRGRPPAPGDPQKAVTPEPSEPYRMVPPIPPRTDSQRRVVTPGLQTPGDPPKRWGSSASSDAQRRGRPPAVQTPGDPQNRGVTPAPGDPQRGVTPVLQTPGDPQNRVVTPATGDPQRRGVTPGLQTPGDPQKRGVSPAAPGDPQRGVNPGLQKPGEPQKRAVSPAAPGDPQRGVTPGLQTPGDPQRRGVSPAPGDPQRRGVTPGLQTPGDPQRRGVSPAPGDPQRNGVPQADQTPGGPQNIGGPQEVQTPGNPPGSSSDPVLARALFRVLLLLVPVYICGRLGFSIAWVGFGLFLWIFWNRNKKAKLARLRAAWEMLENEAVHVTRGLNSNQLPAWVHFPDVERVEWINKILVQVWPYVGLYMEKHFREKIEPLVRASNGHLKAFTFTKIHFGEKAPRVNGIKAYTKKVDKREVILDMQFCYNGDCEVSVEVKKLYKAGVSGIQIHGTVRVILAPLMSDKPFAGAITFFFLRKPHLEINWTGLTNILDIPGVSNLSDAIILDLIASYLVLPNRFTFPLCSNVNAAELRFPIPHGVLRLFLYEAENLIPKDTYLRGMIKGKSDPYAVLRVGTQTFKSKTIQENLNPLWNEVYEFVVHEVPGQDLEIDLFDEDPDKDDFLGSLQIALEGVMKDRVVDEWFPLCDVVSGSVHLKLEWHSLLASPDKLCEAQLGLSSAMVIIYLDSGGALPVTSKALKSPVKVSDLFVRKSRAMKNQFEYSDDTRRQRCPTYPKYDREPRAFVLMGVGNKIQKSKTCSPTTEPVWEQAFTFFIQDVYAQHLHLEVKNIDRQYALGTLDFPLHCLLTCEDLTMNQRFPLENSGPSSFVKMKVVLRVMHIEAPDPESVYAGINNMKDGPISIRRADQEKPPARSHKVSGASNVSTAQPQSQGHVVPQNKVIRRASSTTSNVQHINKAVSEQNLLQVPQSQSAEGSTCGSAPRTPNLAHLQRIAPSLISLNSLASSVFDLSEGISPDLQLGEINISVRYASLRRSLIVSVNGCRNLIQCSSHGADPYVRMYLLPDRKWSSRKKTSVKKKTLNPIYNERFEFLVSLEDAKKRALDIAVKNHRQFGSQERKEMGKVLLDMSLVDVDQGFTDWFELTSTGQPKS
ncbi:extended synaptotagmin-3 isoform X2 [Hyperolius riggenbachi]|uniref:extended synaptotagmin-3 isoform X2 n=1 Tax=Hyperolius riggenbachi TaxID=752182 RepID=UPI0035A30F21